MAGIVVAFKNHNIFTGIWESPWAGLKYFEQMINLPVFYNIVRNTLSLNIMGIVFGFPAPIILALLLNELRQNKVKKLYQSLLYLPHFMSWIILAGIISNLLSPQYGFINHIIKLFGGQPIFFMASSTWWVVIYIISGIWQSAGWGTIIYIAALTGIDQSLYEAAKIDGAGKWKQAIHITLPCLIPTVIIMFILRMGQVVSIGFEQPMAMYNPLVSNVAEVMSTFIYSAGVEQAKYSLTTAIGLFQSVINLFMVLFTNWLSKRLGGDGLY
jgi:putative aldouronate transport system permease protein